MAKIICTYCGSSRNIQNDHVKAQSKGGVTTVPACSSCNQSKSDKQLMTWLRDTKEGNSYKWNRIVDQNKGKRSTIAQKIRKIRDEK